MSDGHYSPNATAERQARPQRSKDTCDMCSASKVKCDKRKPICSRCERLNYPCFYSPARRVRKHRRLQTQSLAGEVSETAEPAPEARCTRTTREESIATESNASDNVGLGIASREASHFRAGNPSSPMTSKIGTNLATQGPTDGEIMESTSSNVIEAGRLCRRKNSLQTDANSDCTSIAMDLLQSLESIHKGKNSPANSPVGMGGIKLDAAIDTAAIAIKRTSTILVCPCSKKMDVGLSAAAVCAALLDVYAAFSCDFSKPEATVAPSDNDRSSNGFATNETRCDIHSMEICTGQPKQGLHKKAIVMRILRELPKVADLVTQFRNRYNDSGEDGSQELLKALVAFMTSRLKSVIDECTHWLVES